MNHSFSFLVLLLATLGSGLMSGLFFVFSNFAMKAFSSLPASQGAAAMQAVNVTIINPAFLAAFLGSALISLVSAGLAVVHWGQPGAAWAFTGAVLYLGGCFLVTIFGNVPLNNELAALDIESAEAVSAWQQYIDRWMPWNHVRALATLFGTGAFAMALRGLG